MADVRLRPLPAKFSDRAHSVAEGRPDLVDHRQIDAKEPRRTIEIEPPRAVMDAESDLDQYSVWLKICKEHSISDDPD